MNKAAKDLIRKAAIREANIAISDMRQAQRDLDRRIVHMGGLQYPDVDELAARAWKLQPQEWHEWEGAEEHFLSIFCIHFTV